MGASTYYKNQLGLLSGHTKKSGTTSRCGVAVKAIVRDFQDTLKEGVVPQDRWLAPQIGKGTWAGSFQVQIAMYDKHEFVGITGLGLGEAWVAIEGSFTIVGMRQGKLQGSLKEQVDAFANFGRAQLEQHADFVVHHKPFGGNPLVLVPPMSIMGLCAPGATVATWSFGAHSDATCEKVRDTMGELLQCWPVLEAGMYKALADWLGST